jgi:hypothetical protein
MRVSVLAEALPYLQRFAGQTVVVKYGGAVGRHTLTHSLQTPGFNP